MKSPDNIINQLFEIESKLFSVEYLNKAKKIFAIIMSDLKKKMINEDIKSASLKNKVTIAYKILNKYVYLNVLGYTDMLTTCLLRNTLDCDASSFMIIALAEELKKKFPEWDKIGLISVPQHTFLKLDNNTFADMGEIYDKEMFMFRYKLNENGFNRLSIPLKEDKLTAFFLLNRSSEYSRMKKYQKSLKDTYRGLLKHSKLEIFYLSLGNDFKEMGEYKKAVNAYKKGIKTNPYNISCYINLIDLYIKLQKYRETLEVINEGITINPWQEQLYFLKKKVYEKMYLTYDFQELIKRYISIFENEPNNHRYYYKMACVHKIEGNIEEALNNINKAIKIEPNDANFNYYRATIRILLKENMSALPDLFHALDLDKSDVIYRTIASCFRNIGNIKMAMYYAKKAISLNPYSDIGYIKYG